MLNKLDTIILNLTTKYNKLPEQGQNIFWAGIGSVFGVSAYLIIISVI